MQKKPVKKVSSKKPVKSKDVNVSNPCTIEVVKGKHAAITSVRASAGVTVSTGDYESARYDFSVTLSPIDICNAKELSGVAWEVVKGEIIEQVKSLRARRKQ